MRKETLPQLFASLQKPILLLITSYLVCDGRCLKKQNSTSRRRVYLLKQLGYNWITGIQTTDRALKEYSVITFAFCSEYTPQKRFWVNRMNFRRKLQSEFQCLGFVEKMSREVDMLLRTWQTSLDKGRALMYPFPRFLLPEDVQIQIEVTNTKPSRYSHPFQKMFIDRFPSERDFEVLLWDIESDPV